MTGHTITLDIDSLGAMGAEPWFVRCTCGWHSAGFRTSEHAVREGEKHQLVVVN